MPTALKAFQFAADKNILPIDIVGYPKDTYQDMLNNFKENQHYCNHFRLGGLKLIYDGSIQGVTAYLSKPYHTQPDGKTNFRGSSYYGSQRDIFIGPQRAARMNPLKSALDRGMRFTLHHDAPVTTSNMMIVIQSAVNRVTTSGKPLGREFEIPVIEALKAVTINVAWQEGEENIKGSLEVGKLADLVILSANPLKVKPTTITDIKIIETIKEGKSVYVNPNI